MSVSDRATPTAWQSMRRAGLTPWGIAGVALLLEYLLISYRFDAYAVAGRGGPWELVGSVGAVGPFVVVAATALIVLRGIGARPRDTQAKPNLPLLLVHAALASVFWLTTDRVFGRGKPPDGSPLLWLSLWAGLGAASALTLLLGVLGTAPLRRVASVSMLLALGVGGAAWAAGNAAQALWTPLTRATFALVVGLLSPFVSVTSFPETSAVELRGFHIVIDPVCSGLEGIGLVTVLSLGFLAFFRAELRYPRALLLLPLGIGLVWLGNGLRVAMLLIIGAYWDPEIALGGFHSKAGWVLFCAITLGLSVLARRSRFFWKEASVDEVENPTAAFLMPALTVIATGLVTGMFAPGFDALYGVRIVTAGIVLYAYRHYYLTLERRFDLVSVLAGLAVGVLWVLPFSSAARPEASIAGESAFWITLRIVGALLVAPICEELAFRGFLLRRLMASDFTSVSFRDWTPLAVIGSSLAFGMLHERWVAGTLAGIAFAAIQHRRGRLVDAVAAHAAANVVLCAWMLWTGDRSFW
jgi:exosortase E/protease (VPEID-CTERM system)